MRPVRPPHHCASVPLGWFRRATRRRETGRKEIVVGTMRILDETGDTMVTWSLDDTQTLERATKLFDAERAKGSLAFSIPPGGRDRDAERITRFDPGADEIVWVRQVAGG